MRGRPHSKGRAFWLKQLHRWHWISAAVCLIAMLLFTITGITLNHATDIEATPRTVTQEETLPPALIAALPPAAGDQKAALPPAVAEWLEATIGVRAGDRLAEWTDDEIYLPLPRPGGDGWVSIDRTSGAVVHEATDRGAVSWLNDLHKGRNTGRAWKWFIDIVAVACLIFTITGLVLLQLHARNRPSTWPLVGVGFLIPALIVVLLMHG